MIVDGVELPQILPLAEAADLLGKTEAEVRAWIAQGKIQSVRLNGIVHVVSESIAERLGQHTPSRHNQDSI